ncbi:MAG: C4-type zinc ribbon domain-containing protein [Desulfobacterales bacterium]
MDEKLKENFDTLVTLQEVEIETASVQAQLAAYPRQQADLEAEVKAAEEAVVIEEGRSSEVRQAYRALESEAKAIQGRIIKSEEKLRAVKTNKEYQSSLKEIDDVKAALSAVEDRMLACLEEMDLVAAAVDARKDEVKRLAADVAEEKDLIRQNATATQQQLDRLTAQRAEIIAAVPADMLKTYETVKRNSGGVAIAAVKNAVCRGCHVNLPPQMYHDLLHFDKLLICPHCERLIYPAAD